MKYFRNSTGNRGFTLLETLVVVAIILILAGIALPVFNGLVRLTDRAHTISNMRQLVNGVALWAADHSGKIPSPLYPGGHVGEMPAYSDIGPAADGGEPGMWLNGVVYATLELGLEGMKAESSLGPPPSSERVAAGAHLVGTVFESRTSVKQFPDERDWFRHSFAMNANLQYDEINDLNNSSDPWLTEKDITKFNQPKAMLFIDCIEDNIVYASNADLVIDAADRRYGGAFVIAAFLDGSVRKLTKLEIPMENPNNDRESSQFWRGMDLSR